MALNKNDETNNMFTLLFLSCLFFNCNAFVTLPPPRPPLTIISSKIVPQTNIYNKNISLPLMQIETIQPKLDSKLKYKAGLLFLAMIWGSNFGAIKVLESSIDTSTLNTIRFFLATISLSPWSFGITRDLWRAGIEIGLWVTFAYFSQSIGLESIDSNKSAFICCLSVIIVPLLNGLRGKKISNTIWISSAIAIFGVGFITLPSLTSNGWVGIIQSLVQPLGFGMGYILLEKYKSKYIGKELSMAFIQMLTVFTCSLMYSVFRHDFALNWTHAQPSNILIMLYTGCITSAFAIALETKISSFVDAEDTALILTTEPIWALVTSMIFLHESIGVTDIVGSCLIFLACIVSNNLKIWKFKMKDE